ncbi:hypothetical protein LG951_05380 [Bacillus pumilus]|uniref:hypothetical protein n=1 Tax=Bacillus pumilus TaxID=1408 RepID=UPI001D026DD5|nr:hypothetical protein [Bacillus pumilus]UDF17623.1 hypothetical protein LG951_05380 [Bacillus pumilus]
MAKKKVRNIADPKKNVSLGNPKITQQPNELSFNLSYKYWMKGVSTKDFSNKLPSIEDFSKFTHDIFSKLIPTIYEHWKDIILRRSKSFRHCHLLENKQKELALMIAENIHDKTILDEENDFNIWQFGFDGSVRLVAVYDHHNATIYPIFVDYHHHIYPSIKYNQNDFKNYNFCPHSVYSK